MVPHCLIKGVLLLLLHPDRDPAGPFGLLDQIYRVLLDQTLTPCPLIEGGQAGHLARHGVGAGSVPAQGGHVALQVDRLDAAPVQLRLFEPTSPDVQVGAVVVAGRVPVALGELEVGQELLAGVRELTQIGVVHGRPVDRPEGRARMAANFGFICVDA